MGKMNNKKWILSYLIFLSAVPPLTTDMYLPALPSLVEEFRSTVGLVNLTLVLFFMFFSGSILLWGTLSDKYGRRTILILCSALFTLSGFLCAVSGNVYQLIVFRVFQAIGGGAALAVSMAVMKDVFLEKERARALALSNMFMVIAPITAPIIGALILKVMSWRGIFLALGGTGCIAFAGALIMRETTKKTPDKSITQTIGNLLGVLKNPGFAFPLPLFAVMSWPVFMFIGASADIYVSRFGLSEQTYSLFFGANAAFSALGPVLYMVVSRYFGPSKIIKATFFLTLVSGLIIILFGNRGAYIFAGTLLPATIATSMLRPPSSNLLLEQVDKEAGAASSMMIFSVTFIGSLGMQFISLGWNDRIFILGLLYTLAGLGCLLFWPLVYSKCRKSSLEVSN
jgi:DHA1 family bicyclomycin/chloramphenicol resistance-like MFS transporter